MELNEESRRWIQVLIVKAAQATSFCGSGDQKLVEQYLCETVKAAGNAYGAMLKCGRLGDDFEGSMTRAREACEYADEPRSTYGIRPHLELSPEKEELAKKYAALTAPDFTSMEAISRACGVKTADRAQCFLCFFPAREHGLCSHHLEQRKRAVAS